MLTADEQLFHEVGELLLPRGGWSLEPSPTPGGPSSWCFEVHGRIELSVNVAEGQIVAYLLDRDEEVLLGSLSELSDWLAVNRWTFDQR